MKEMPKLIKDPKAVLEHLFMEPVFQEVKGHYFILSRKNDVFDTERLLQLYRLYPQGDIVLGYIPHTENRSHDSYRLALNTDPEHLCYEANLSLRNYHYERTEGLFHWYRLVDDDLNMRGSLPLVVGCLIIPEEQIINDVLMAYSNLDAHVAYRICRPLMRVNGNSTEEYKKELEREFAALREKGIDGLFAVADTCRFCYPGAKAFSLFSTDNWFQFRMVITHDGQGNYKINKCENNPYRCDASESID